MNPINRVIPMKNQICRLAALAAVGLGLTAGHALAQGPAGPFPETSGKDIYEAICQSCHMPDGSGSQGAGSALVGYPALANNPKLAAGAYPALVVARGLKAMPQFGTQLNDTQIANVANYIRTQWGNAYATAITPAQVAPLRPKIADTGTVRAPG
jgi:mono/diheme cytochrome c family protein